MKNLKNLTGVKILAKNDQKSISGGYNNGVKGAACYSEGVVCPETDPTPCCSGNCLTNAGNVRYCG